GNKGSKHVLRLWKVETGKEIRSLLGDGSSSLSVQFSPDGRALIWGAADSVRWWDPAAAKEVRRVPGSLLAFSPDGKEVAVRADREVGLPDATTGKKRRRFQIPRGRYVA